MIERIGVVVPARDEEERIEACLGSIQAAIELVSLPCHVIVVADSCTDSTAELASRLEGVHVMTTNAGSVGIARALGVRRLLEGTRTPAERLWIANTDADSVVPEQWLSSQIVLADAGCDVIVGTVRPHEAEYPDQLWPQWRRRHPAGHANGHVHGANLGVRASAYCAVGGFPANAEHEDVALVEALSDFRVVASAEAEVVTSARLDGRTPGGYAAFLRRERSELMGDAPATA
jgi:glycosyltransferase involved in cell wall biosynthesis